MLDASTLSTFCDGFVYTVSTASLVEQKGSDLDDLANTIKLIWGQNHRRRNLRDPLAMSRRISASPSNISTSNLALPSFICYIHEFVPFFAAIVAVPSLVLFNVHLVFNIHRGSGGEVSALQMLPFLRRAVDLWMSFSTSPVEYGLPWVSNVTTQLFTLKKQFGRVMNTRTHSNRRQRHP